MSDELDDLLCDHEGDMLCEPVSDVELVTERFPLTLSACVALPSDDTVIAVVLVSVTVDDTEIVDVPEPVTFELSVALFVTDCCADAVRIV